MVGVRVGLGFSNIFVNYKGLCAKIKTLDFWILTEVVDKYVFDGIYWRHVHKQH